MRMKLKLKNNWSEFDGGQNIGNKTFGWGQESYTPKAELFFAELTTQPTAARKSLYNDTILALQELNNDGLTNNFEEHDLLFLRAAADQDASLTTIVNPSFDKSTPLNSPTFTVDRGWTGTLGGNKYLNWNYTPGTDNVKYLKDDSCYWFYSRTNVAENSSDMGVLGGGNISNVFAKYSDNKCYFYLNQSGNSEYTMTDSLNLIAVRRPNSTTIELWQNGILLQRVSVNSTALVEVEFVSLARNNNGSIIDASSREHAAEGIGSSKIDLAMLQYQIESVYLAGVGADLPRTLRTIVQTIGQSNFTEFKPLADLPAQYKGAKTDYFSFFKTSDVSGDNGSVVGYHAGNNSYVGDTSNQYFGVTASLAYKLWNTYGISSIISNANIGNTSIYYPAIGAGSWNADQTGLLLDRAIQYFALKAKEKSNPLNKMVWVVELGENDATDVDAANSFYSNMVALITKARLPVYDGGTGYPDLKFIIVRIKDELEPVTHPYTSTIQAAVDMLEQEIDGVYVVDAAPVELDVDLIHYTSQGDIDLGELIADKIDEIFS